MKLTIAAVGKGRKSPEQQLAQSYGERLPWRLAWREVAVADGDTAEQRRQREAAGLTKAVPSGATRVALDGQGLDLASADFARRLGAWRDDGVGEIAFVIGGPDGLERDLVQRCDLALAFGRATWPHMLVRVLLAEQLYRASAILSGHPYHKG